MRSRDGEVKHIFNDVFAVRDEARALTEVGEDETRVDKAAEGDLDRESVELA